MKHLFYTLFLFAISACSASSSPDANQRSVTPEEAAKARFEDIHEVMELTEENLDPLFQGNWDGSDGTRKDLAFHAEMLIHGFGWLQTTIRPKTVDDDFSQWAKQTQGFMRDLASAADKDSASVKALFANPAAVGIKYCSRCHKKYRDDI